MENQKNSKLFWIGTIGLVALYFASTNIGLWHRAAPSPKPLPPNQVYGNYLNGKWLGYAPVENRGTRGMILQINNLFNPGQLSGAVNVGCIAPPHYSLSRPDPSAIANSRVPTSATMTAPITPGTLQFHVDKNLGGNCTLTTFSLTPFAVNQLAAEWKDSCGTGQLILTKSR
jgi:hypothetical protein